MFTDMQDFSGKMSRDENRTLRLVNEYYNAVRDILPRYQTIAYWTIGDAFLVIFASTLNAMQCALEIQESLLKRNKHVTPEDEILVRIGIHLGDVIVEDNNILGDSVNIASRVESKAEAGGICISRDVYRQIRGKVNVEAISIGEVRLRNIEEPIELFKIEVMAPEEELDLEESITTVSELPEKPPPAPNIPDEGTFRKQSFPMMLYNLYRGRSNGALDLQWKNEKVKLFFTVGMITGVDSNYIKEMTLSNILRSSGRITADQAKRSFMSARQRKVPHGDALSRLKLVTVGELFDLLVDQAAMKVCHVFSYPLSQTYFQFNPKGLAPKGTFNCNLDTGQIIYQGVCKYYTPQRLHALFHRKNRQTRPLIPLENPHYDLRKMELRPTDRKLVDLIDGRRTLVELRKKTRLPEYKIHRVIYPLLVMRCLKFKDN